MNKYLDMYASSKQDYLFLKQKGGNYDFLISGPVSMYYLDIKHYNKKVIMFGDVHASWTDMCFSGYNQNKKGEFARVINACNSRNECFFITDFIEKVFENMDSKKDMVTLMFEAPDGGSISHQKGYRMNRIAKDRYMRQGQLQKADEYGPLHYIETVFTPYIKAKEKKTNHVIDWVDIRHRLIDSELYTFFRTYAREIRSFNRKIGELDNKRFKSEKTNNTEQKIIKGLISKINLGNVSNQKISLGEALMLFNERFIIDNKKHFLEVIEKNGINKIIAECPKEIREKLDVYISNYVTYGIDSLIKSEIDSDNTDLKSLYDKIVQEFSNINTYEKIDNMNVYNMINIIRKIKSLVFDIEFFLIDFYARVLDVYVLAKIFSSNNKYYIIYMGDNHIQEYVNFMKILGYHDPNSVNNTNTEVILQYDIVENQEEPIMYPGKNNNEPISTYNRCIEVDYNLDRLVQFK